MKAAVRPPSPMLAGSAPEPFSRAGWVFEVKYDGFRLLVVREGPEMRLFYRSGHDATGVFPELVAAVRRLPARQLVLDGEVVVAGPQGRPHFDALQARAFGRSRAPIAQYMAFDLLELDGRDLRHEPLVERKARLAELVGTGGRIAAVEHVETRGEELFLGVGALELEGIIAKRAASPYRPGRTRDWLKIKHVRTESFLVVGVAAASESTFGMRSLLLAEPGPDGLRDVGWVAVPDGVASEVLQAVPRQALPPARRSVEARLEPLVEAQVRFFARTASGNLRGAVFEGFTASREKPSRPAGS